MLCENIFNIHIFSSFRPFLWPLFEYAKLPNKLSFPVPFSLSPTLHRWFGKFGRFQSLPSPLIINHIHCSFFAVRCSMCQGSLCGAAAAAAVRRDVQRHLFATTTTVQRNNYGGREVGGTVVGQQQQNGGEHNVLVYASICDSPNCQGRIKKAKLHTS